MKMTVKKTHQRQMSQMTKDISLNITPYKRNRVEDKKNPSKKPSHRGTPFRAL